MNLRAIYEKLKDGKPVTVMASGTSMIPYIRPHDLITIHPANPKELEVGDIVLAKVRGRFYLHRLGALSASGMCRIENAEGHVNGWCSRTQVFGVVFHEPPAEFSGVGAKPKPKPPTLSAQKEPPQ